MMQTYYCDIIGEQIEYELTEKKTRLKALGSTTSQYKKNIIINCTQRDNCQIRDVDCPIYPKSRN